MSNSSRNNNKITASADSEASLAEIIFVAKNNDTPVQLFRYVLVGGISFLVDIAILVFLTEYAGLHYLASAAIAFIFGLTINYLISIKWVFHIRKFVSRRTEFILYGWIGIIGLGLNELFIWYFTETLELHYVYSKIAAAFFVFFWNFFARKYAVFE